MNRIEVAAKIINNAGVESVIDLGCRDCVLGEKISVDGYVGVDIYQNNKGTVNEVVDVMDYEIPNNACCIVALDLLEHLDDPYKLVMNIFNSDPRMVIINLPNIYDLKGVKKFLFGGLGGKYKFGLTNSTDRHRWLMNDKEIVEFYKFIADRYGYDLDLVFLYNYGRVGKALSRVIQRYFIYSITGKFSKR